MGKPENIDIKYAIEEFISLKKINLKDLLYQSDSIYDEMVFFLAEKGFTLSKKASYSRRLRLSHSQ